MPFAGEVSALAEGIARQARCAVQQTKRCIRHGLESGLNPASYEAQALASFLHEGAEGQDARLRQSPPLIGPRCATSEDD